MAALKEVGSVLPQAGRWGRDVAGADIRVPGLGDGRGSERRGKDRDNKKLSHIHLHDFVMARTKSMARSPGIEFGLTPTEVTDEAITSP